MTGVKITAGRAVQPKTAQSKAAAQRDLKNASCSFAPWCAKARRL